jgi:hypothetical protein
MLIGEEIVLYGFRGDFEEDYVTKLMKIGEKMNKAFSLIGKETIDNKSLIEHRYFKSLDQISDMSKFRREWERAQMTESKNFIFINSMKLPSIALEFSYFQDGSRLLENRMDMVSMVGLAVGGISDARINIDGIIFE